MNKRQRAETLEAEIEKIHGIQNCYLAVPGDIGDPSSGKALVSKTVEKFGKLDVFVSNAGICPFHEFTTMPEEVYYRTVKTNLDGAFFSTQAAAAQMIKKRYWWIHYWYRINLRIGWW
jgi:L-rhamnose 1-dehydrogenase